MIADAGTGIRHVVVNGRAIRVDGEDIERDERPGRVLRGEQGQRGGHR